MKRGDIVAVCYDGKWGRRVPGRVLATDRGSRILVRFEEWANDKGNIIDHWFKVQRYPTKFGGPRKQFGGYVPVEGSLMASMFNAPGDWYSVFTWEHRKSKMNRDSEKWLLQWRAENPEQYLESLELIAEAKENDRLALERFLQNEKIS